MLQRRCRHLQYHRDQRQFQRKFHRTTVGWLAKLKAYKSVHGNCNVPRGWAEDPGLGQWVADQRRFADWPKARKGCARNFMSDAGREGRLAKLEAYKQRHGDCNVPARWAEDPRLGS